MQFKEDFPALPAKDFQSHYILVFDLASLQNAAEQMHYTEISGESLRLDKFFPISLKQVTKVIVLGGKLSDFKLTNLKFRLKRFFFQVFTKHKKLLKGH